MRQTAVSAVLLVFLSVAAFAQTPARPRITGVSHIAVYTSNAAAAEHYYVHDIGLKKGPDPEDPAGVRYYVNSTQFIEVMPLPANAGNAGLVHFGYITTDAEALRLYLADHRYAVPDRVHRAADGSRWFSVKDPEGNKVQFVQPAPNALSMTGADPIGRHVIHVGERVKSADAENAFYRDLLGFKPYWFGGMKPGKTDWISQQVPDGHDWLEYMMESGDGDISQRQFGVLDHLSIGVVNMEQAVTTLDREGRLNNPHTPMQIGRDGKWQYNLFDPDGTRLELMEFTPVEKPCCSPFTAPNPSPDEN
jgi:catechol 2,3-dioxygenase-like lactoylglutathione lyase family enzyme